MQGGDLAFQDVVGGSIGKFEFDFTRGNGGSVPGGLSASSRPTTPPSTRPPPAPSGGPVPQDSSMVRLGENSQMGDVTIGDIAGRNKVHLDLSGPASLNDPRVSAAARELTETLAQHAEAVPVPNRGTVVDFGPGSQFGDVQFGDVIGGNKLAVRVKFPQDVTPEEAVEILNGVRDGLQWAYALGEANARSVNTLRFSQLSG